MLYSTIRIYRTQRESPSQPMNLVSYRKGVRDKAMLSYAVLCSAFLRLFTLFYVSLRIHFAMNILCYAKRWSITSRDKNVTAIPFALARSRFSSPSSPPAVRPPPAGVADNITSSYMGHLRCRPPGAPRSSLRRGQPAGKTPRRMPRPVSRRPSP